MKEYEKPSVESEDIFETLAAGCDLIGTGAGEGDCDTDLGLTVNQPAST